MYSCVCWDMQTLHLPVHFQSHRFSGGSHRNRTIDESQTHSRQQCWPAVRSTHTFTSSTVFNITPQAHSQRFSLKYWKKMGMDLRMRLTLNVLECTRLWITYTAIVSFQHLTFREPPHKKLGVCMPEWKIISRFKYYSYEATTDTPVGLMWRSPIATFMHVLPLNNPASFCLYNE